MYVTWELILSVCAGFSAICLSVGYLIKIIKGIKRPADEIKGKISSNEAKIDDQEDEMERVKNTLDYLVNANNLVIRSLFTVLGELATNNDVNGNIAKSQKEIQNFLTPVKHESN